MLSVYMAVRVRPFPKLPPARAKRVRSLDPDIARVERESIAAFDAVPLEGLQKEPGHGCIAVVRIEYIDVLGPKPGPPRTFSGRTRSSCSGLFKIRPATDRQVGYRSLRNRRYRA